MRFLPRRKRKFWLKSLLCFAGLLTVVFLGGCKLFMSAEIRGIEKTLNADARDFQHQHPDTSHTYTVGNRQMHYVETGTNGVKPLVLFIHGSPGSWRGWVEYLKDSNLCALAHLIAVDRPGFGASGPVERSLAAQCRDIAPLLDHAAPGQRIILVGHSFGGPVACRLAMDHPDKVTDVIILAGSIDPGQEKTHWYQYPADWWIFRWLVPRNLVTANREIRALKGGLTDLLRLWPKMNQRVTVIQGEADQLVPPENADFAKKMLIHAQSLDIIRLPGMNHFLPWKKYDLVKSQIINHTRP